MYKIQAMKAAPEGGRLIEDKEYKGRRLGMAFEQGVARADDLDAVALFHLKRWGAFHVFRNQGHGYERVDIDAELARLQSGPDAVDPAKLSDVTAAGAVAASEVAPVNLDAPAPEGTPTTPEPAGEVTPTKDGKPRGR